MIVERFCGEILSTPCDALVVAIPENWRDQPTIAKLGEATDGWLTRLLTSEEISTRACKAALHLAPAGLATTVLVTVGLGSSDGFNTNIASRAASTAFKLLAGKKRGTVRVVGFGGTDLQQRASVTGAMIGSVGQDIFRAEKSLFTPDVIQWCDIDESNVQKGSILGAAANVTRGLVNLPPNYIYPESLANEATKLANECNLEVEVWDKAKLVAERCGALLGVAQGSSRDPRLVILKYHGGQKDEPPIALVGKGVTFDSGGLSIKPTDGMLTMKCDMAGAATVLGIMQAIAKLKVSKNVVAVIGLVENMISGDAFKLGDVLTARSGKTIEIHNTDAEGRLVLADCLNVALESKPEKIVDFATLTGACCVALGLEIAGLMTNNPDWQDAIRKKADECGEYTWPLPMHSFFSEQISGKVADIKNVGEGRYGGAMTAAKFLEEFVDKKPWTHIDIAGPAFLDSAKSWCDGGGTGVLVRTFAELLMDTK